MADQDGGGEKIVLSGCAFVWHVDNRTIMPGGENHGYNTNMFRPPVARSFGTSVVENGCASESVGVVLQPEKYCHRTPALTVEGYRDAASKFLPPVSCVLSCDCCCCELAQTRPESCGVCITTRVARLSRRKKPDVPPEVESTSRKCWRLEFG